MAPLPTGSFQNTIGQLLTIAIPPDEPPIARLISKRAFQPTRYLFNPFQQIISGGSRARLADFGNRVFRTHALLHHCIKGDKLLDGAWGYDAAFRYSQVRTRACNAVSISRFNRILNAADVIDPASSEFIRHDHSLQSLWRLPRADCVQHPSYSNRPSKGSRYLEACDH